MNKFESLAAALIVIYLFTKIDRFVPKDKSEKTQMRYAYIYIFGVIIGVVLLWMLLSKS